MAEVLTTDPTTLTRNVKPLSERGLVKIVHDVGDRRRRLVTLTKEGGALIPLAYPLWRKAQAHLASLLGVNGTNLLNEVLDQSLDRLA